MRWTVFLALFLVYPSAFCDDLTKELIKAIMTGDEPGIEASLSKGVDVNAKTGKGVTPLMLASLQGNLKAVKSFISKGALLNEQDSSGLTALKSNAGKSAYEQATEASMSDVGNYLKDK
jgi:ankyrin repeat protein